MMRTVAFRAVLEEVLGQVSLGLDTTQQHQLDTAVNAINRRVSEMWDWVAWPEAVQSERRGFCDAWQATLAYVAADVVWDVTTEKYYVALGTVPAGTAVSNGTYWEEDDTPDPQIVAWEQYNATELGRVWRVTNKDLRRETAVRSWSWIEMDDGLLIPECTESSVFVLFNSRAPRFSGKVWSVSVVYNTGDIVLSPGTETTGIFPQRGECYVCRLDTEGNYFWEEVQFPGRLEQYVIAAAGADLMRYYGQKQEAGARLAEARTYLEDESGKVPNVGGGGEVRIRV